MSKAKRLKPEINHVIWHRDDENIFLETLNDTLKGHEDDFHKCCFFDYNKLMTLPKYVNRSFMMTLFKLESKNKNSSIFRNQQIVLQELFDLTEIADLTLLTNRLIRMEEIHHGKPVNIDGELKLDKMIVVYFTLNGNSDNYQVKEKSSHYLDNWEGPQIIRDEITRLEEMLETLNRKFEEQLSHLISLQQEEYHIFEKNKEKYSANATPKEISDMLLELRSSHNKELEEIKVYQEAVVAYIKKHSKKLSLIASEIELLENINKIQICKICGHVIKISTETPANIPEQYVNKNGSVISMEENVLGEKESEKDTSLLLNGYPTPSLELKTPQNISGDKLPKTIMTTTPNRRYHVPKDINGSMIKSKDHSLILDYKVSVDHSINTGNLSVKSSSTNHDILNIFGQNQSSMSRGKSSELKKRFSKLDEIPEKYEKLPEISQANETADLLNELNKFKDLKQPKDVKASKKSYLDFLSDNSTQYKHIRGHSESKYQKRPSPNMIRMIKNNDRVVNTNITTEGEEQAELPPQKIYRPPREDWSIKRHLESIEAQKLKSGEISKRKVMSSLNKTIDSVIAEEAKAKEKQDIFLNELIKKKHVNSIISRNSIQTKPKVVEEKPSIYKPFSIPEELLKKPFQPPDDRSFVKQNKLSEILTQIPEDKNINKRDENEPQNEKDKYVRAMMEHIKKSKHDKLKKAQEDNDLPIQDPEKDEYIRNLIMQKPWLTKPLLRPYKLHALKLNFPLDETAKYRTNHEQDELEREVRFIKEKVEPFREKPRETKTDIELSYDMRYYNKYGDFLMKRLYQKNYYERLEVKMKSTDAEIKTAYRTKALIWHPDNIKKNYKTCFANEADYKAVITEIFAMIDEAYKTLSSHEKRRVYDMGLHHF